MTNRKDDDLLNGEHATMASGDVTKMGDDGYLHVFDSAGNDRTQAMLEHATRVQFFGQVMNQVAADTMEDFTALVVIEMNERKAGCLSMPTLALLNGTCHEAVAVAMPRVQLKNRHPAHPTLQ